MATWTNTSKSTDPDHLLIEGSDHEFLLQEIGDRITLEQPGYNAFEFKDDRNSASFTNKSRNSTSFTNITRN